MSDDDGKDTQVLSKEEAAFLDMEGTEEMDRAALLARLQADAGSQAREPRSPVRESSEIVSPRHRDTQQQQAISEKTIATDAHPKATPDPTQHYVVPDSLLNQTRDTQVETVEVPIVGAEEPDYDLPTTTFSMDSFLEFQSVVDDHGRIALPESAIRGKFGRGARLKVVVYLLDD